MDIIGKVIFLDAVVSGSVHGFIVGNGGLLLGGIEADHVIAGDMDLRFKLHRVLSQDTHDAVVRIDDFQIGISEIGRIAVDKTVIPSRYGEIPDAVAGEDIYLHTVVADK